MYTISRYANPVSAIGNILDDFLGTLPAFTGERAAMSSNWPAVDMIEKEDRFIIHADLPGVEKDDISVDLENGIMSISGEKKVETQEEKGNWFYYERSAGKFRRSFQLPDNVKQDSVNASYHNGVLELTLLKNEKTMPRKIEVKIG